MSDLQCPARLYVARLEPGGRVAEELAGGGPDAAAAQRLVPAEERLAAVVDAGDQADLEALADLHRGEAVLVLVSTSPPGLPAIAPGEVLALEVDSDGPRMAR